MRKQTGLRNRGRMGVGTYSRNRKKNVADKYGTYVGGRLTKPENVAGNNINAQLMSYKGE